MRTNGHAAGKAVKTPAFVLRAERALRRAAKNVQNQNRALKLPVIVWQDGKVVEKPARIGSRLHHGGPQGAKPKAEVVADILASLKERKA